MSAKVLGLGAMIVAMGVTCLVTPLIARVAGSLGGLDHPGRRKLHARPVPRVGGVAIYCGFVVGLIFAAGVSGMLFEFANVSVYWRRFVLAATVLFAVGLIDDIRPISFKVKFAAQIAAALFIWNAGFRIDVVSNPFGGAPFELGWISLPLTVLWIVGITNAVNLIDGLDGLATGVAIIMTAGIATTSFLHGDLGVTATSVVLLGSLIGFLWFNFNPAKIFLGDSGSLFVGFVLAVMSVRGSQKGPAVVAVFVPLLLLGLPLLDTGFAVARRSFWLALRSARADSPVRYLVRNLNHLFMPDRKHIHHRLLDLGLSHRRAVLTLYGVATLTLAAAMSLVVWNSTKGAIALLGVLAVLVAGFLAAVYWRNRQVVPPEPREAQDAARHRPAAAGAQD